ncbi:MAG: FAD-binding protein [Actinomycetes bacterium]
MTLTRTHAPAPRQEALRGWGRTHCSHSLVARPHDIHELTDVLGSPRYVPPLLPRASGCSYGDAATCAGGTVLDLSPCRRVVDFDPLTGQVVAEAGLTLGELARLVGPYGWSVPVLPGTPHVSLGGAVAADVHGKNHVGAGSFGRHVLRLGVAGPDGSVRALLPQVDGDEFWATVGGMGLTGAILLVGLQLRSAGPGPAVTTRCRAKNLAHALDLLDTISQQQVGDPRLHVVAWLDAAAPRTFRGRGLVQVTRTPDGDPHSARACSPHAGSPAGSPPAGSPLPSHVPPSGLPLPDGGTPSSAPSSRPRWFREVPSLPGPGLMTRHVISTLNRVRWLVPVDRRPHLQDADAALNPLRRAAPWPALFGRRGLVQYQFVVPAGRVDTIVDALSLLAEHRLPPALATLKRLGPEGPAPLSFPLDGWALALDFPAGWNGLEPALAELDDRVADAGGRVYLAKDSRLSAALVRRMYPRLGEWQQVRDRMDPAGLFASDLSRRLHLTS